MSAVEALAPVESIPAEVVTGADALSSMSEDDQLSAIFDRVETNNGSDRGENGKFKSPNPEKVEDALNKAPAASESVLEGADTGEAAEGDGSTLSPAVPLPANWNGKDEIWSKVPDDLKSDIAAIQNDLQNRLTTQGRQIADAKPITDTVSEFRHLFEGRIEPAEGIRKLAKAQENLENPNTRLQALMGIIDSFGARQQLAAILSGQIQIPTHQQPGIAPQDVDRVVDQKLAKYQADVEARNEVVRLSNDKPLYSEIPETTMVHCINAAWSVLGEGATKEAIFNFAYDMATDSIPALKAKKTAAAKPVVVPKPVSPEAAKRANSVNVPSTSTGKVKERSEEELLSDIYDRNQKG